MQSIIQYRKLRTRLHSECQREYRTNAEVISDQSSIPDRNTIHQESGPAITSLPEVSPYQISAGAREQEKQANLTKSTIQRGFDLSLDGDKEFNPREWSLYWKLQTTLIVLGAGLVGGWVSSNDSSILSEAMKIYNVSDITESLATGLNLIAFGVGSLISGPFSETAGRNPIYLITLILFMLFIFGSAMARSIGAQLVCRFFAGIFGCTAVTTFAGSVADLWNPRERSLVFSTSSAINFSVVFIAPVVGGFIAQSTKVSWRWTEWTALIMTGLVTIIVFFLAPETNFAVIQSWKVSHVRRLTGNPEYGADHDTQSPAFLNRLIHSVYRPFDMIIREITIVLFTLYLTVLYIVTFTFLMGYTFIYMNIYGLPQSLTGLCFLGLVIGIILASLMAIPLQGKYQRDLSKAQRSGKGTLPPEQRLVYAIIVAPALPIGLFWMAWTSKSSISYWSSLAGSVFIGMAFLGIFVSSYLYLMDIFEDKAASALAIATFVRYAAAGAMVPVSIPMYRSLGVDWTLTVLACISLLLTPLPFLFYRYGHLVRQNSYYATKEENDQSDQATPTTS